MAAKSDSGEKRTYKLEDDRYQAGHGTGEVVIEGKGDYTTDDPAEQEVLENVFGLKPSKKTEGGS